MNEDLARDLIKDEGMRLFPYKDTVGKLTIGVGRNLDEVGITQMEAEVLLRNDINRVTIQMEDKFSWVSGLPEPAYRGLLNMAFNLGVGGVSKFKKMLTALEAGEWHNAANEALDSKWAIQVGQRSKRIADLFYSCEPI